MSFQKALSVLEKFYEIDRDVFKRATVGNSRRASRLSRQEIVDWAIGIIGAIKAKSQYQLTQNQHAFLIGR